MKYVVFRAILILPFVFLILFMGSLTQHFFNIQKLSPDFEKQLEKYYSGVGPWERDDVKKAMAKITDRTIVVLGESTLVVPGACDGTRPSDATFPALLKKKLKEDQVDVLNLGYCGDDSRGVVSVVRYILAHKKPRAFLFYFGHNDYSNAGRDLLHRQTEFIPTDFWLRNVFSFLPAGIKFQMDHIAKNSFEAFLIKTFRLIDPRLFNTNVYKKYSDLITAQLEKNIKVLGDLTREANVPVVFVSPVGNLLYPPVGSDSAVASLYEQGLGEKNFSLLLRASDSDFFGYDQRAKSEIAKVFLNVAGETIRVLDLPRSALTIPFSSYGNLFSDIFHFTPAGHAWVLSELEKAGLVKFLAGANF